MKKLSLITRLTMFSLLFVPLVVYAESGKQASNPPPVAPALVREGDFASKLAGALNMGTPKNETEAESMLSGAGIAPRNGWISDYPMTPDVIVEVQKATGDAADGKRLALGKEEALKAFRTTALELEIPMIAEGPSGYAEGPPPTAPQYTDSSVVDNYYYDEGPPVYSYYPPPWDYAYLYAWVPYPFYWTGFFFPGFFILNDFDRCFFVHGRSFVVSNHFFDHDHHRFSTVNPVNRWRGGGESLRAAGGRSDGRGFATAQGKRGAESILQRSHQQMTASRGPAGRNFGTSRSPGAQSFAGRGGSTAQFAPRQNFRGYSGGSGRSFSPPSRSFSSPSMAGRSYSGGFQGGGGRTFSGGFTGGGFSHGGSFGGGGSFGHGGGFGGHR